MKLWTVRKTSQIHTHTHKHTHTHLHIEESEEIFTARLLVVIFGE